MVRCVLNERVYIYLVSIRHASKTSRLHDTAWHCLKQQEDARLALLQQRSAGISSSWLLSRFSKTARQSFVLQRGQGCSTGQQTALARLTHADSCSCRCTGWTIFSAALHPIEDSGFWALSADPSLSVHICNRLSRIVRMAHDAAEPCTMAHTHATGSASDTPAACLTLRVWLARLYELCAASCCSEARGLCSSSMRDVLAFSCFPRKARGYFLRFCPFKSVSHTR